MRVRIALTPEKGTIKLPYNYGYFLSSIVYSFLKESDSRFSKFLHHEGYYNEGKTFKLFTFSPLLALQRMALRQGIVLGGKIEWLVSSPKEKFLFHLTDGILEVGYLIIKHQKLLAEQIEVMEPPVFSGNMSFRALSPIVVSTGEKLEDGTFHKKFLSPSEPEFYEILERNLRRKYKTCYGNDASEEKVLFEPNREFIAQRRRISKLIEYKGIKIRGWMFPFRAKGNPELIKIGYEAGFGEGNSAGFGMVEVRNE